MRKPDSLVPPISPSSRVGRDEGGGWDVVNSAWIIVSHLLTGIALYGGLGWLLSLWIPHRPLLIGGGALIGMFLAIYLIHRRLEAMPPAPPIADRGAAVTHSGRTSDPEARRGR